MNEELEFLWYHMRGDFGLLMAVISWVTAARLVFKPVTQFLQSYITQAGEADGKWATRVLESGGYKFIAFLLDYLASVKLPTRAKTGATALLKRNGAALPVFPPLSIFLAAAGLTALLCFTSGCVTAPEGPRPEPGASARPHTSTRPGFYFIDRGPCLAFVGSKEADEGVVFPTA